MTDARNLTLDLGGKWHGRYGVAPCPICQPEKRRGQNALTLSTGSDGRLLAHCKKAGCDFRDLAAALGLRSGDFARPDEAETLARSRGLVAEADKRARQAEAIWREAQPIAGTPAETYLRFRGITCELPDTLRFYPLCWHGATAQRLPALVALVAGCDRLAVHRTYLRPDGLGKAAAEPAKTMLGATAGGAVTLQDGAGRLVVAEGIETALSLASGLLPLPVRLVAALSTSGMQALRLPAQPGRLTIASDSDDGGAGLAAARTLAERAYALGWQVSLLPAPEGQDWNDVLTRKGNAA